VTYTRCRVDTINSPDDGHMAARKMWRIEINIHKKELCVKFIIYKYYTEMHGQQNIKNIQTKEQNTYLNYTVLQLIS